MKLKHFIFVFLAMLSFAFSGFAQTTVTSEAELRAVLESAQSGSVVLGNDIELSAQVTIPKKIAHTLDLNGKKITGGLYVYGTLTINDQVGTGELTASTYVLNGAGGSKIILNGGRVYRGSSWSVYTTGIFVVNGGEVANTIRVAGSGSIQLNGGTVTAVQVTSGNLNITGDAVVEGNLNIEKGAKSVNIADGTINGDITIATEATDKVEVSGGTFKDAGAIKDYLPGGSALLEKPDGTYEIVAGLLKIGDTYYPTLDAAFKAAADGATIELINQEGSVIAMNGSLYGKSVTITGTAKVDWSKGFLFVARGGEGNATLTFDNAFLTSVSDNASTGIHVSSREKGTNNKYDGTLVIKNSTIDLDYLINKGAMTLDNSTLTVKNGFDLNGRPASETENGEDANATLALTNNSKLVVINHNGMGIGREGKGELTVDASSTFEHTQDFIVRANGTMDVKGTLVSNGKKLTNNGEVKFTATKLTAATIDGTGTTRFYNDVNFYGANSITTDINGTPFHLVINEGANLLISRFTLGYDRNITVNGTIADASAFNPEGQTPSLKFNSTSGVSVGGTGTGNLQVKNAYIELGNSSWKNAQGTYVWDFVNSYVSAVSFTNATGADAATWDVTFDKSVLDAKNYIKNGKNVTYNFTNNSRGTTGSLRIDGELNIDATSSVVTTSQQNNKVGAVDEHGGINGTVNVAGNLTIGSNAKTQLEVLGGTVNVVEGATLALGNNTLTLDAASAMQSAGNISGAITAANGANVAISGGTYTQDVSNWCADGFMTQQNADGSFGIAKAAAKIGDKKYSSLDEAVQAAKVGDKITLLDNADLAFAHNPQYNNVYASEIDLNGKTMTIKKGDVRFDNVTIKNGNIIVQPGTYNGTAIFLMYSKNLTLDSVNVTATGVAAPAYLIGLEGTSNLALNNSEIVINNESLVNIGSIIADNGNGNTVTIKDSKIDIKNSNARLYLGGANGKITVENSDIDLNGVKEGFYLRAGQTLAITGTSTVDITLNTNEGRYGINLTDATAKYTKAETATVNATTFEKKGGKDFNGYTGTDGIWGETWGNAKESFVIKVLDANGNVMGTTSLNNIGGIINGNVNVSWNLKFNAAANTDQYWTMAWATAPSISNMPARVALWVDGVEVSGGSVVLNGPDDLNKIVAAVTDADGKILSCHTSVANAAATNATNIALLRNTTEEISLPVGTILNKNGFNADKVTVKQPVVSIGDKQFATFAEALAAVENGQTITLIEGVTGDEKSTELTFDKDIKFTITGKAPQYALPVITFQNAEVTIKDAEILIPELDARQNAVINIVNSTVHDAGGNSIAKSYYNGTINIDKTSTVYMMQITTMGYINVAGTVNASWQTNVYGNGMIALAKDAKFNTGALHLTGKDYSGRDNTDTDRVGKPATIVVDGATFNVGSVKSDNGADYSYNSSKGINVGTIDGKLALLDIKNGGAVNFYMANGETTNFGAGATVNVAASTLKTICRDANGTVTLVNNGTVVVTGNSQLDVKKYSGNAIQLNNGNLVDTYFAGRVDAFGTNNISGTTTIGDILSLGYGTNPTEQVVVNITGNFTGTNVLVSTNNGVDNILNVGKADGERTTVHFDQLGAFADVNVVNTDVTYGYAFIRNDFNATNSTFAIKGGVNTYFSGNAKVVLDNTTWNLSGFANIGSYGGYMYGNADVTLKNGSSMTATSLGVEVSGEKVVKLTLEDNSSLTATKLTNQGSIVLASVTASLNSNECANVTTSVPNQVVSYIDGKYTLVAAVAQIGGTAYTSLQAAINAVKDGETIILTDNVTGNVTLTEKVGLHYTIDGAGKTMNGKITITPLSDENDNRRITIKGINFVNTADAAVDFISCAVTNHYPRLTVEGCTFTGNGKNTDVALRLKTAYGAVIKDCTGTGLHSFLQNTAGKNFTIENVKVTKSKGAFALGTVQGVTIKGSTIDVATYGIRLDANTYNNNAVIEGNEVTAFIPVVVRSVNTQSNVTFTGENAFTAENTDGKWMVIGTTEYEEGVALPAEVAEGNVVVALNGTNLSYEGVHGAGLAGKGTAEAPYLINNVAELEIFRNSVNAGSAKYSKPGLCVALNADIDMTGVNWVGIGSATKDHGFMGNFDGKNFKIKNLTITNPALDSDGYAYAGLFGVTEGTDKDNQNTIKNLTIENVTINTTGHIAAAAIAYPYYTNVDNVKVCGNIAITGGNYTAGVLAYTRRCVNASNLSIVGNEGSFVKGNQTVGGVISDIQMNGGLTAVYSNFSAEGIKVTGEKSVGGIAGIIATQTLNGATVKNVTLDSTDELAGVVAGRLGGTSTISNVVSENVTGATAVIGATFDGAKAIEARIGDTYYSTFAAAYTAAKAGETVTMLADLNMSEILVLDKAITLNGNGNKLTSTAARAINVDCEGNVGIKNLTINASGERAINVIQKPANVTIENVTATAANYTVNVAASAPNAVVAIKGSNLTGLNVVNVAAPGSVVTISGGTITCNDQNDAENYAALTMNKDAVGAKIAATGVTFDIKGDSKKASNQAEGGTITIDGSTDEVEQHVAYISYGNNWYGFATLEAAIAKANAGETVTLLRDINASAIITIDKTITLDGNGKTLTSTAGRAINVETEGEVTISNLTINAAERAINIINKPATVTLNAVTATANNNAVMIATSAGAAKVTINGCNFTGLAVVNVAGANAEVAIKDTKITNVDNTDKENYGAITVYSTATNANVTVEGGSIIVADDSKKAYIFAEGATVTGVDQVGQIVAMIGDAGYETLEEAISGAKAGQTVKLVCDITVANPVTIAKSITLDGANKTLTYTGTNRAIEMPNVADANYDVTIKNLNVVATTANRGLNYNDNGKLNVEGVTVTIGENVDGYAINFPGMADGAQVTIKDSKLTSRNPLNIWGENMTINVHNSEIISVDNSTTYDYAAIQLNNEIPTAGPNGAIANGTVVNVYGGTITALNDKGQPSNVVANATETGVVNISDETVITGKVLNYVANIGGAYFGSLQAAVNAIEKHGYNSPIVIMKDFATSEATTIKSGLNVTINLNGKTITGTDNATGSFGLITNKGNLTINGEGAITLVATNDRDWNAYSSVISNTVGGKLTVNGGTIQHLGGTDMAYAIDNLTNGKGTYAETIINGGAVKSTYRAIRQFLNGVEAENILTVNGGTIEGTNKSIWMQDPSKNSNTGTLTVAADAKLTGDVYLSVTAGSTEWPVEVAVAATALQGESKVLDNGNVPAGYDLAEVNGTYGVYTGVAKIGTAYYETLKAAVAAAQAGETITLIDNVEASEVILLGKSLTINGNGYKVTSNASRVFRVTTANTEVTLNDVNMVNTAVRVGTNDIRGISIDNVNEVKLTLNNCSVDFTDASACDWAYAVNVTGGDKHTITVDAGTYEGANVINVRSTNSSVVVKDATLNCLYPNNDAYMGACIYVIQNNNTSVEATGNTFNGDNAYAFNLGNGNPLTESDNIDNTKYVVAKIGNAYYTSIQDAIEAAQDGETVRLIQNVKMDTKTLATQNDGYAVLVNVNGKKVAIDLNGKKITVNAAAADLAAVKGKMLLTVFHADTNGELTLTDNTADKAGAVVVNVNDATVYSVFASESQYSDKSESGKLTVNAGNYTTVGKVANAMFFTDANEVITVNGGNFHCDQVSNTANYPWMFNTLGNNELRVTVNGGTFNIDVNHQHRPFEVKVPETLAVKAKGDGTWTVVSAEAYITEMLGATVNEAGEWGHKVGYATIAEAIAAVNELGNKVSIAKDVELTETVVVPADKTMVLDLNGKTVTMNDASGATAALLKNNGNLTITDGTEAKAGKLSFKTTTPSAANAYASNTISNYGTLTIEGGNVENLSVGGGACYALDNYAGSTATINGGKLTAEKTAVRIFNWTDGEAAKATLNMNGGEIYSKNGYGINVNSGNTPFVALNIAGGTITTDYADYKLAVYVVNKANAENLTINVTGGTFNGIFALNGVTAQTMKQGAVAVSGGTFEGVTCYDDPAYGFVSGGTFKSAVDAKAVATGFICKDNGNGTFGVIVDPKYGKVAQIIRNDYYAENQYFATINDAVQAAVNGETVTLIADVETSAESYAEIGEEGYAVLVAVKEKDITLNLNGKSVTVTPTAEELADAEGKMLMSVFGMDTNGKLTLTGNGSVKVNANGANVYSLVAAYGEGSAVVIENGNYEVDAVIASGSLIYSHEMITVMGGTFKLGNLATGANGSPWIFNTIGQNYTGVKVVGGTYPTDINHQFWANEVLVPAEFALQNNGDKTWTVVDAVAYTNEKATSRNASWRHVGYASLEDAIAATGKYNCQDNTVTVIKDMTLEPLTVANGVKVAIDLNCKTISATDNSTASYGLITNKGDLTINGTGAITLEATQDRGWSAYSSVISNQVGGKLTVNGGTIQHLGGTSMAYAIDNLTNGKGTYAETIINGGEIKSTYRPIRMFLNGVDADNILTVNAGTIEGTGGNKAAIWMQTAGDVAHSGTLYVGENAVIKNNVYLDADNLKNVREYLVEAYIAKAALAEGMTVLADNIPAEAAALVEYDTFWQVEQKKLAELTIEDDCEEYINKIEKNVGVLTYEREFDDTEWQTIVLPFDVPVANLTEQFEVAYIYNASYKGKQATIDYVVIDKNSAIETLRANYPYMIRAKEAGWNNIVVENAKLMPTKADTLDCSSIFEKFSFIGNYATVDADNLDATKGYFSLNGTWSKMEVVNPFRFYMQIEKRNGAAFEYPNSTEQVRMRQVNANGGTTGIGSVGADQNVEFIFDLNGRRVAEPQKGGIYIVNGKKILF